MLRRSNSQSAMCPRTTIQLNLDNAIKKLRSTLGTLRAKLFGAACRVALYAALQLSGFQSRRH
jgi:hypothetical protein